MVKTCSDTYDKYKDSGIEWIGKIPEDWSLERLQWCMDEVNIKNQPIQTTQVLSLTNKLGVVPYEEKGNQGNKAKEDISEYKLAYTGSLIVNSMNVIIGSVGISNYTGCVSPVYYVFNANEKADLRFINYIFSTIPFQKELRKYAKGILEIRLRVSSGDIFKRPIALPIKQEQQKIAEFLDEKCSHIDSVLDKTKASIEEYKNLKQAVITQAVTKGIRPNRPMKDSGIEWIGEIPDSWRICKVKYLADLVTDGSHIAPDTSMSKKCFASVVDMDEYGNIDLERCLKITDEQYDYLVRTGCNPKLNDILISKDGTIGKTCVVTSEEEFVVASSLVIIRPKTGILPKYFRYILMSDNTQRQLNLLVAGTALKRVSVNKNANLITVNTTNIDEQKEIVAYLDVKCAEIDKLIEKKEQLISELETYKKSLIYEYVTGKKEVM